MVQDSQRQTLCYLVCQDAEFLGPQGYPVFRFRLTRDQILALLEQLDACAVSAQRRWFTITSTRDNLRRLRLTEKPTPQYEQQAAKLSLRGKIMKVGVKNSINIDFSSLAAALIAERLRAAMPRMREFVEIRAPNRHRKPNLLEFIPDVDLAEETSEHQKLALASEALAAECWPSEDFSDWETARGED